MLPPTVAMLRTCRPPITAEACVSAMRFVWKPGCVTTASCVAMAPITYPVGVSPIVSSPRPARLIRCFGACAPTVDLDDEIGAAGEEARSLALLSGKGDRRVDRLRPVEREAHRLSLHPWPDLPADGDALGGRHSSGASSSLLTHRMTRHWSDAPPANEHTPRRPDRSRA